MKPSVAEARKAQAAEKQADAVAAINTRLDALEETLQMILNILTAKPKPVKKAANPKPAEQAADPIEAADPDEAADPGEPLDKSE